MIDDQRTLAAATVRVREDVLVHPALVGEEIVQTEVVGLREELAAMQQRRDLALVPGHQLGIGHLIVVRATVLHAVPLGEALDLAVAKHRQPRHRRHHRADPEVLVALPELVDRGPLVRVVHEVHVALQDLRIELERVLHDQPVLRIVLVAQHDHERAVVNAMHAERPDEVGFHEPECFGQQERSGRLRRHPVHDLAPELDRHQGIELGTAEPALGARWDRPATPRLGEP